MGNEILVIGYFGYVTNKIDGQTIKTRNLLELLELKKVEKVNFFDTELLQVKKSSFFQLLKKIVIADNIFYLGAHNNLKYFFPVIWLISLPVRKKINYFVIGGWLPEFLSNKGIHRYMLKRINGIYCETESMGKKLSEWYQFKNIYWFPNYRTGDFVPSIKKRNTDPLKLIFMARIIKSKGYERVFKMAQLISEEMGDRVTIDFYGPLPENEKEDFYNGLNNFPSIRYRGVLDPQQVKPILSGYDVMLFPTNYPGEGFPGTILDSYISGIPVIASDWRYNSEFIVHGETGYLFNLQNEVELYKYVNELYLNRDLLYSMKQNAYAKSKEYSYEIAWEIICKNAGLT